jgi:purine-binding chemotaxis protein CheW
MKENQHVEPPKSPRDTPRRFDWETAKQRLARIAGVLQDVERLSPERAKQVLDERARVLARTPPEDLDSSEFIEVVTFRLGGERFALETRYVREILHTFDATPVPDAPGFLHSVTDLRGEVLAVMDVRGFLSLPETAPAGQRPWVLVLGTDRVEFGLLTHAVGEVTKLRVDQIHPPPGSVAAIARDFVRGVTADALIVLDGGVLLADDRLIIDQNE